MLIQTPSPAATVPGSSVVTAQNVLACSRSFSRLQGLERRGWGWGSGGMGGAELFKRELHIRHIFVDGMDDTPGDIHHRRFSNLHSIHKSITNVRASDATEEHLVNICNIEITTTCEVSKPNSQLQIRVHRLAAASDGFLLVSFQLVPDGVKETAIVWALHPEAAFELLVCQVHDVDHRTEPVPVHVGGSLSRHFGLYLCRTHHDYQKELLTPRQRRHRSSDCGSCSSKISVDESCILR
jgi:hypothetical protein